MRRVFRTSFTIAMAAMTIGFAIAQVRADRVSSAPAMPSSGGTGLSFGRSQLPVSAISTADLARAVTAATNGSFSVNNAQLNVGKAANYQVNLAKPIRTDIQPNQVAAPAIPEPTTMLLLGTGLLGAAAVLRRRLKGRKAK